MNLSCVSWWIPPSHAWLETANGSTIFHLDANRLSLLLYYWLARNESQELIAGSFFWKRFNNHETFLSDFKEDVQTLVNRHHPVEIQALGKNLFIISLEAVIHHWWRLRHWPGEGKVLRVFSSGRTLPRNQGWTVHRSLAVSKRKRKG